MVVQFFGRRKAVLLEAGLVPLFEYTAGEDIPANSPVCKGETDETILLARATIWNRMPAIGIAVESKQKGKTVLVAQGGVHRNVARDADFAYDDPIFISTTLGKFTNIAPN